jgi:hypothetical protein
LKTCTKCVLPANYPNIKFNDEGVCNYCENSSPIKYKGEPEFRKLIESYRGKGKKYDCLVPFSGGKDSTFVLHQMVKFYNMRVLACNYDSGFASEQAKMNVRNAVRRLGIDFVSIKSKRDIQKKCLRDSIVAWSMNPSLEIFPILCYGCEEGYKLGAYKIAASMGVPLIILGDSEMERSTFKKIYFQHLHKSYFIHLSKRFFSNPFYYTPMTISHHLMESAEFSLPANLYRRIGRNPPKILHYFSYVPYDEKKSLSTVSSELGWRKAVDSASTWRFDCQVHALADYMFRRSLGFSETEELYSKMIREGILTKDEVLKRLELDKGKDAAKLATIDELFSKLGLLTEKENILQMFDKPKLLKEKN